MERMTDARLAEIETEARELRDGGKGNRYEWSSDDVLNLIAEVRGAREAEADMSEILERAIHPREPTPALLEAFARYAPKAMTATKPMTAKEIAAVLEMNWSVTSVAEHLANLIVERWRTKEHRWQVLWTARDRKVQALVRAARQLEGAGNDLWSRISACMHEEESARVRNALDAIGPALDALETNA